MKIYKFPNGPIEANMYVLETPEACVIIDPCVSLSFLPAFTSPFRAVLITHCHYDHINRMEEIRDALHIPVYAHRLEFPSFGDPALSGAAFFMSDEEFSRPDQEIRTDVPMDMGEGVRLDFLHTPGHTMGSVCILVTVNGRQRAVFTGDTLFNGSAGRTDLGGNPAMLHQSLHTLSLLDDDVVVYSGHGPDSTIGEEKTSNPFMRRYAGRRNDGTVM